MTTYVIIWKERHDRERLAKMSITSVPSYHDPVSGNFPLVLKEAKVLLTNPYLPMEAGWALNSDGMYHVAGHTYMKGVTGSMIDWWFGYVTNTEQYKQW